MSGSGHRLLDYAVWNVGKWYLRRRLRPLRRIALSALGAGIALSAAVLIARRRLAS